MYFDDDGNLILWKDRIQGTNLYRTVYVPFQDVKIIWKNLQAGKKFVELSPRIEVSRKEVGYILAYFGDWLRGTYHRPED